MRIRLSKSQFQYYSSVFKTISEGILLGTGAAYFLPEVFQMDHSISVFRFVILFLIGTFFLIVGGILLNRGSTR